MIKQNDKIDRNTQHLKLNNQKCEKNNGSEASQEITWNWRKLTFFYNKEWMNAGISKTMKIYAKFIDNEVREHKFA